jgi:hypothetical protein
MRRFLILSAFLAGVTLSAQVAVRVDTHRYYDRDARDYHQWNDQEDRAYRAYLTEQHREYRGFAKNKAAQQREYFKWRHVHPDNTLFKVEVR